MLKKRICIITISLLMVVCMFTSCSKTYEVLENPDFLGEITDVPPSKLTEPDTALNVVSTINENGYKIESAYKTNASGIDALESYRFNSYGVSIEVFKYADDSERFQEILKDGKYIIRDDDGNVLREYDTVINGHYVMIFSSSKDYDQQDRTEDNNKVKELFLSMQLS